MEIKLKLRCMTAYFSPNKPIVADNEDITIHVVDKGQFAQRVVLLCNGNAYLCMDKAVTIPRSAFKDINVFELQEREHGSDRILRRVVCENLLILPCIRDYEGNRLVTERTFYQQVFKDLLYKVSVLEKAQEFVNGKVDELENGKFSILKFNKKGD